MPEEEDRNGDHNGQEQYELNSRIGVSLHGSFILAAVGITDPYGSGGANTVVDHETKLADGQHDLMGGEGRRAHPTDDDTRQ